jgi:hypothetical protein
MSRLYMSLWHPRLPRKISAMLWLISAKGLLVEAWRTQIGLPGSCKLCQMRHLEDSKHFFGKCNRVAEVWKKIQSLKDLTGLPSHLRTWDQILWGEVSLPNSWSSQVAAVTRHEQSYTASTELHGRSLRLISFGTLGVRGVNVIFGMKVFM